MISRKTTYVGVEHAESIQQLSETELNEVQAETWARELYEILCRVLDGLRERDWAFGDQVKDLLDALSHFISAECCRNGR